jgi:hypothetical protein
MPNNTTARTIRPVLRKAGLEGAVERITTGRNYTYVRLDFRPDKAQRVANSDAVLAALRPLWNDGETRVTELLPGDGYVIIIRRKGWYRTEPAVTESSADLARLLRIIADGREEYAYPLPPDAPRVLVEQRDALLTEAAAFRSAALIAEGGTDILWRLLPTWRLTPEVEELARKIAADAAP